MSSLTLCHSIPSQSHFIHYTLALAIEAKTLGGRRADVAPTTIRERDGLEVEYIQRQRDGLEVDVAPTTIRERDGLEVEYNSAARRT